MFLQRDSPFLNNTHIAQSFIGVNFKKVFPWQAAKKRAAIIVFEYDGTADSSPNSCPPARRSDWECSKSMCRQVQSKVALSSSSKWFLKVVTVHSNFEPLRDPRRIFLILRTPLNLMKLNILVLYIRVVSDVGFPIFADEDANADFAFYYPRMSDADFIYFMILIKVMNMGQPQMMKKT